MKKLATIVCVLLTVAVALQPKNPCKLKEFEEGFVCVCTSEYCDTLDVPQLDSLAKDDYVLITSSKAGHRFDISSGKFVENSSSKCDGSNCHLDELNNEKTLISIDHSVAHKEIIGFGTSFSGAVTYLLNKLPMAIRESIYKGYYSSDVGMNYSLMRIPIGGCDFDFEPWAYHEYPENDAKLTNFTELDPRDKERVALIKELIILSKNDDIKLTGAAWSPPRWMKQRNEWPGYADNQLKPEFYQTWADYHLKYLDLMHDNNITFYAISTGNEPSFAPQLPFLGLHWNASDQGKWLVEHLGPTIKQSKHKNVEIHACDDGRNTLPHWMQTMTSGNEKALEYISAIGVHGYFDKTTSVDVLDATLAEFGKPLLYTEMCFGVTGPISHIGPVLGSWSRAEEMIDILMENLLHDVVGYIDWNMILDERGQPNYINNTVDAPIIVSDDFTEIYKQPMYYVMAHFSKFLPVGSRRIDANISNNCNNITALAFARNDSKISVMLYNPHDNKTISVSFVDKLKGTIDLQLKPKSLNTLIYAI